MKRLIGVVLRLFFLIGFVSWAEAASPSIPGNPGVPGLLAQIATLTAQVATLQSQLNAKDAQIVALQSQIITLNTQISTLRSQLNADDAQITTLNAQVSTLTAQIDTLQNQLDVADAQIFALKSQIITLNTQISTLNAQVSTLQSQIDALNAQIDTLESQAPVAQTGQTTSSATGDDGDLEKGVALPTPRFTNNADGTITDNLTGLIWLENANCFGAPNWATALTNANGLASGACGLSDGSVAGDWRLPNIRELHSLVDFAFFAPALSNAAGTGHGSGSDPFSNFQTTFVYWSSTTSASNSLNAWFVGFGSGNVSNVNKFNGNFVLAVRGGS